MTAPLLAVRDLARHYRVKRPGRFFDRPGILRAVDGVSFAMQAGQTLGLVGESGCGKSTTGKLVLGLIPPTEGEVQFDGAPLPPPGGAAWRDLRRQMQMVFQDPLGALDRRLQVGPQVLEPLTIHNLAGPREAAERARAIMEAVGLQSHYFERYPHELSGGQRQRVVLARALITEPKLLVCDEPISALDVSIQAQVVNLLLDLQDRLGVAYLFISHDLRVVRQVSHDIAVMYLGRLVEHGSADALIHDPIHPYTRALVSAIPVPARGGPAGRRPERIILQGDPPNPIAVPTGCAFHPRCPLAVAECRTVAPVLRAVSDGRLVACHRAEASGGLQAA
jgi:peptide/nickel transport system ATP-binding protein